MTVRAPRRKKSRRNATSLQNKMDTTISSIRQYLNDLLAEGHKELAEVEDRQNIKKIIPAMALLHSYVDGLIDQDATLLSHVADIKEIGMEYQGQIIQYDQDHYSTPNSPHGEITSLSKFFKLTLNQLEAWLEVVCGLLQYAYRPPSQEQDMPFCPVHALMAVYLFDINRMKNSESLVVPEKPHEILGTHIFSKLLKFAKSWPISCIPEGVFIPKSFSGETNILMDLLIFFKKHEIDDSVCCTIFRLFFLGDKSSSASAVFRKPPSFSSVYRDEEIKHDEDSVTQSLSRKDRNRILAFLIKHQYQQTIKFLMDTYLFSLSDDDLCWICQHSGILSLASTVDEEIIHWLYQLKFGLESQENDLEEFRNNFRVCLHKYFEVIQASQAKERQRAVDSFLPVAASSTTTKRKKGKAKKGKKGKKGGKGEKGKNDLKTNPPSSVSENDRPETSELKEDPISESKQPETPELKDDTDTPLHAESAIEWPKILIDLCDSNAYREFNLPGKLENALWKLDEFPDSKPREKNKVLRWIKDFNQILKDFCDSNIDRELINLPFEVFTHGDALSLLRDCAKIIVLCEVFQSWNDSSEKLLNKVSSDKFSKNTESLNMSDWSQWKRSIFLKHSLAFNIKEFIDKKFEFSFIYCSEKRCYQVKDNELSDVVNICNDLLQKRGLIFDFAHELLQKSHQVRVKTPSHRNAEKPNTPLEQTFGELCAQSFFHHSSWDDSRCQQVVSPFLHKNCRDLPPHLNFSTRLTAGFLMLSEKVCLPQKLRTLLSLDEKLFSKRELKALAYTIPKALPEHDFDDYKVDTVPVPAPSSNHPENFHTVLGHPLFAQLLLAWPKNQAFVCLSGCLAGLFALAFSEKSESGKKIDFGSIETYLRLDDSDVDLLTPNDPTSWPRAISKKLSGQTSSYHWQLWGNGGIAYNGRSVPVDLVQITPKNVDMSNDELLENYKENSSITALDAMACEFSPDGRPRWVSGDVTLLKAQIASGCIEMTGHEQFQEFISKVAKNLRKSNDEIDNLGLKLLKLLDTIIKLSYIHNWRKNFSLGLFTLHLIVSNLDKVKHVIENISPQRKQAFLSKIFKKPERYLRNYLLLLLRLKLFGSFFYVDPQNFDNRETIRWFNNIAKSIEAWLSDDTDKSSSRLHNQTVAFLAMEQYLKFQYQQSRTSYDDFLICIAKRCLGHTFERSEVNIFGRALKQLNTAFAGRKQDILSSLLYPKQRPYQLLESGRLMSSAIEYYHPLEMKNDGERPSTVSALAKEQREIIRRELYKQVADVLNKNLPIKKMPKAVLKASIDAHSFSVKLPASDRDSTCMFVVFFVAKGNQWHTFLGVFENIIPSGGDMRVRVAPAVVELLKDVSTDVLKDRVIHYYPVAPYLGILYELDVCNQLELARVRAPTLEKMLARAAGQPVPKVDSLPLLSSLTREQSNFAYRVLLRMRREGTSVSTLTGPPGTGKTATFVQLACEAVVPTDVEAPTDVKASTDVEALTDVKVQVPTSVMIVTHSNCVVENSATRLRTFTPDPVVHRTKRGKLDASGGGHPSLDELFDLPVRTLQKIEASSPAHLEKDAERINRLQQTIQQIMPVFAHQVNASLDVLISQLFSSSKNKRTSIFNATCKEIMRLIRDTSSHKVAVLATARFVVITLHYVSNSVVQHATDLRRMLFPEERILTIVEEASRGELSAVFRALTLSEPHHVAIIGDLAQLPPVTHSDPPPPSIFKWFSVQLKQQKVPQDKMTLTFRTDRKGAEFWGGLGYRGEIRSAHADGGFFDRTFQALTHTGKIPYLKRITFIDVPGSEEKEERTGSYFNKVEAKTYAKIAVDILAAVAIIMSSQEPEFEEIRKRLAGIPCLLAVITMYSAQAALINKSLEALSEHGIIDEQMRARVRCGTVDGFQGSEALFTIVGSVRTKEIGHIGDSRRLTVAVSRFQVGTVFLGHEALFKRNAKAIEIQITNSPEDASGKAKEGVFIQQPGIDDQTLLCLAKGYDGVSVWCRLSQSNNNCRVDVLDARKQENIMDSFELPNISIECIKQKDREALTNLRFSLLSGLSTAVPEPHIQSSAHLEYIHRYCRDSDAIVKWSQLPGQSGYSR